ncbi:histidine phosphatase family protein [Acidaminobacter sp. JC074]|uniref:histidine phosphatase family protein n=1 Tax=Acidaminobacter sp. JC074 TaxID=2530199 RepID=UPI001F116C30|nr:histidine phosphatase family protein [Acidaminobacter sp. JC074]MCH4890156.1 histidine phosphatase family protein [Acidaminobacter sp. JC074]
MTKIYLIRHGETEWNRLTKLQGREDISLNQTGLMQADKVSEYFCDKKLDLVFSSPLKRAYETADVIAKKHDIDGVFTLEGLIERDYGQASGYTSAERKIKFPDGKFEGMEDSELVTERMMTSLYKIARENTNKSILVVSHGSAINTVLAYLSDNEIGSGKTRLHNCSVNLLNYKNESFSIEYFNRDVL